MRRTLILIMLFLIISCDEDIIIKEDREDRYDNPIGAINLTKDDLLYEYFYPRFSPDIEYLLYTIPNQEHNFIVAKKIIKNKVLSTYNLKFFASSPNYPIISPDGYWWVYEGIILEEDGADIFRVYSDNPEGEPERLTYVGHVNLLGVISPDGEWMAFVSDREPHFPNSEIYLMKFEPESEDNPPQRITFYDSENSYIHNLLWSPTGEWLLYINGLEPYSDKLNKINPWEGMDSIEVIYINHRFGVLATDISPDGRWIAVNYYDYDFETGEYKSYIGYISSEAGEQEIKEFFPPLEEGCDCWGASFSPDGEWIAFVSEMENVEGETDIFLYPFEPDE